MRLNVFATVDLREDTMSAGNLAMVRQLIGLNGNPLTRPVMRTMLNSQLPKGVKVVEISVVEQIGQEDTIA